MRPRIIRKAQPINIEKEIAAIQVRLKTRWLRRIKQQPLKTD